MKRLPLVTANEEERRPLASRRDEPDVTTAQPIAVPDAVTDPSVIATDDTLRPFGDAAAGAPKHPPAPKFLRPSANVLVASV